VSEWLAAKAAAADRARRRAAHRAHREQRAAAAKSAQSAEAYAKWKVRAAERRVQAKTQRQQQVAERAESAAAAALKKEQRRAACAKAFRAFIDRDSAQRAAAAAAATRSAVEEAAHKAEQRAEAQRRYEKWLSCKERWFARRVHQLRARQAQRRASGDGEMTGHNTPHQQGQWMQHNGSMIDACAALTVLVMVDVRVWLLRVCCECGVRRGGCHRRGAAGLGVARARGGA
jgi:colicin import membrane protein